MDAAFHLFQAVAGRSDVVLAQLILDLDMITGTVSYSLRFQCIFHITRKPNCSQMESVLLKNCNTEFVCSFVRQYWQCAQYLRALPIVLHRFVCFV